MIDLLLAIIEANLTPRMREAFIDHQIIGRSTTQIAADMGCTRQNVHNLTRQARRRLAHTTTAHELRYAA